MNNTHSLALHRCCLVLHSFQPVSLLPPKDGGEPSISQVVRTRPPPVHSPPTSYRQFTINCAATRTIPSLSEGLSQKRVSLQETEVKALATERRRPPLAGLLSLRAPEYLKQTLFLLEQIALPQRHRLKLVLACVEHLQSPHTHHSIDTPFTHTLARTIVCAHDTAATMCT